MTPVSRGGLACLLFVATTMIAAGATVEPYAQKVSHLIDPVKLATLRGRGANPRVQKYVALLGEAKEAGLEPARVATEAVGLVGMKGQAARLTVDAMVRNLGIAERFGCFDADGLREMRSGHAPTVRRGPYRGDSLSVDHIIPRSVAPELDKVIANLELMPLKMNQGKNAKIGARQIDLAKKLNKAGLLSEPCLVAVLGAGN